jgi:hypothetical protein
VISTCIVLPPVIAPDCNRATPVQIAPETAAFRRITARLPAKIGASGNNPQWVAFPFGTQLPWPCIFKTRGRFDMKWDEIETKWAALTHRVQAGWPEPAPRAPHAQKPASRGGVVPPASDALTGAPSADATAAPK